MSKNVVNPTAQELMDGNSNCCFNCTHLKIVWDKEKSIIPKSISEYINIKAKCNNPKAVHENTHRENPVRLQLLLNKFKVPKIRQNCNFFELG